MANELKPNKGVVVTEINGIKYFKLQSPYPGDYTKNCGLLGNEIDENFFFLRSDDIENITVENGILTLTRVDGNTLKADVSTKCDFQYNKDTGELIITNEKGEVQIVDGFVVEGGNVIVTTNETLDGDGTNYNPLRIAETERTGTYSPAKKFIDMAVYDYYVKISEVLEEEEVYFYREIDKENIPHGVIIVDLPEKPTEVTAHSPEYIRVKQNINLPDAANLGKGYRIVTRETLDEFGLLYDFEGVTKIKETLESKGSLWRIPTREDWAEMLNAAEYCDEDRTHDEMCINEWKGKNAGSRVKSINLWKPSSKTESGLPVSGEDNLPKFGTNTFRVYPVGYGDGSRGAHDINHNIEAFGKRASFWTDTIDGDASCNSNVYTVTFGYDTRKVLQESSKPSSRMSIRLVKDYESDEMNISEIENILGYNVPCVFISNPDTKYSKIWTAINIGFKEPQFSGMTSYQWSVIPSANKGEEIVYYINEWDGLNWIKKQMYEGDSIVILDGGIDESGNTIYNHEWRIYSGETEPSLIDITEAIQNEIDSIKIVSATPNSTTVLKSYMLNINGEQRGVTIDIPKDKAVKEIRLGHMGATVDENTGVITDGPDENSEALLIVYNNEEGKYNLAQINLEDFIQENEFASGITVTDHIVHGVVDPLSDSFLTVGANGFKLSGVQDEIARLDEKIDIETARAIAAEESISGTVDTFSAATASFSAATVNEIARVNEKIDIETARAIVVEEALHSEIDNTQVGAGLEDDGAYIPESTATYVSNATSLKDADTKLDTELARVEQARKDVTGQNTDVYVPNQSMTSRPIAYIESATSLNDADVKLDEALQALDGETVKNVVVDGVTGVVTNNIAVVSISADTIPIGPYEEYTGRANTPHPIHDEYSVLEAVKQVDTNFIDFKDNINDRLDDEIDRATAADNSISGTVNTFSAATVAEVAKLDGRIDNTNTNLNNLSVTTATFSANTVGQVTRLDAKIEAETLRAEAAENSVSGDVASLSSTTASFSAATVNEIARIDTIATRNKVKSTGHTVVVAEAAEGTNLEVNIDGKTILSDNGKLKTGLKVAPLAPGELSANVREAYRLVDNEGTPVDNTIIKIYKSSSLVSVELINVGGIDYVRITYIDNEGTTQTMDLNIQQLIFEAEFKDGLVVNGSGEVRVKIDPTSEIFLTVSSEGIKLDGVQDAINSAVATETGRATAAENSISANVITLSASTESFSAGTVAKFNLMENTWNVPGSIKHTLDDLLIMSVASGTVEEARFSLLRYYNDGVEHKYYASSNAEHMYYNGQVLATVLDNMGDETSQLSGTTEAFSAATVNEIERLDVSDALISGDVNTLSSATEAEITRATTVEQGIQVELDTTQLGAGLNSDGTYNPHDTAGDMGNYIATATSLDNADFLLDAALKAESDRAIAAEQALNDAITGLSSDVSSLSGVVETFSSATVNEISRLDGRIDTVRTGAGLKTDGTYHKHNTAGDMGNYIEFANSLDEATVMLDSALKTEETRATDAENSISGTVNTFSAATEAIVNGLQNQLNEANSKISALTADLRTLSGVVETMQNEMATTIYNTVKAILQGTTEEIKVTPNDVQEKLTVGFADDAVFGPISLGGNS